MTAIAAVAPKPKSRFLLDRAEIVGPLFIAPAILYVLLLVALPFFLAIYYSVSAYTIFDPNYRFVGLKNFLDVVDSEGLARHKLPAVFANVITPLIWRASEASPSITALQGLLTKPRRPVAG